MPPRRPEILAPAGDLESLRAALAAGADAVYFGLDEGFNARARADNFPLARLPETMALVHRAGARAYLTLNTLLFEPELPGVEKLLRGVAAAGVDALIVQDPAVALLARAVCPQLELHASTQMTVSSAEGIRFARGLGVIRVVVPRELSTQEIRRLASQTDMELEVFIHGALCVSWSGQCLTSEAWGGRSANRGQCAQSCRMPYDLVVDGQTRELGEVRYLLSPKDLAGVRAVPELVDIGVHSLKIEGRLKGAPYVTTTVGGYRRWVDGLLAGAPDEQRLASDLADMSLTYSRGLSHGFLGGSDHQTLVEGRFPKHRGLFLGRVRSVSGKEVLVIPEERPWTGALGLGEERLTCSHDLDEAQLFSLLEHAPAHRFTVALHHHIATFHTEHCVYSHTLSNGRDYRSCGRPCERHQVALRDRIGLEHPVIVDVGCRNTVFNAQAQSAASLVPRLLERGVRRFRVEFVRESQAEAARVLAAYQDLLAGRCAPAEAVRRAAVHEQFGVTRGTMKVLG